MPESLKKIQTYMNTAVIFVLNSFNQWQKNKDLTE